MKKERKSGFERHGVLYMDETRRDSYPMMVMQRLSLLSFE